MPGYGSGRREVLGPSKMLKTALDIPLTDAAVHSLPFLKICTCYQSDVGLVGCAYIAPDSLPVLAATCSIATEPFLLMHSGPPTRHGPLALQSTK
jgi:hypothetical protein